MRLATLRVWAILLVSCNERETIQPSLTLKDIRFPEHTEIKFPVNQISGKVKASFLFLNSKNKPPEDIPVYFDSIVQRLRPMLSMEGPQIVGNYYDKHGKKVASHNYFFMGGKSEYYYNSLGFVA